MSDPRLRQAYCFYKGQWPYDKLPSGVMFFDGLKITLEEFLVFPQERIQQLEDELQWRLQDNHVRVSSRKSKYDLRIQQLESRAAALYSLAERTCGDGCHCMKENNEKCALMETDV